MPGGRSRGPLPDPTKSQARVEIVKSHENRRSHSVLPGDLKQRDAHGADCRYVCKGRGPDHADDVGNDCIFYENVCKIFIKYYKIIQTM